MTKNLLNLKNFVFSISLLFYGIIGISQTQSFTTTGTFTVPAGVTSVTVEAWGGGGKGGARTTSGVAGGGGGGAYSRKVITVSPGANIPVNVGLGSTSSSPGGDSWFQNTSTLLAKGGASVANNILTGGSGGTAAASIGDVKFNGGNGALARLESYATYSGGGGSSACSFSIGSNGQNQTGAMAPYYGGDGGNGRINTQGIGTDGLFPGGGGGGGLSSSTSTINGGNGANGLVKISWRPIISVFGNNKIITSGSSSTNISNNTFFGSTSISTPIIRTFTITNSGSSNITLSGTPIVSISGSTEFSVIAQPTTTSIANSVTTTFQIRFNSTSIGLKSAIVSITNNDTGSGKNPFTFKIEGVGKVEYSDTDGDGIFDYLDKDDDNDGIPDSIEQSYASLSAFSNNVDVILLNEDFGNGTTRTKIYENIPTATTTYCYEDGTAARDFDECDNNADLNDGEYTIANSAQIASWGAQVWYKGIDHTTSDGTGRMALFNATNNITAEFYRTTIHGVTVNIPTTYSFWVLNLDREDAPGIATRNRPDITVEIRDLSNNLITTFNTGIIAPCAVNPSSDDWKLFTASFIAPTTSFFIIFKNNQPGGSGNDLALDDIVLKQTFLDSDLDGVPDLFDLDTDNDGIGDVIEAGFTNLSFGKDTISLSGGNWIDANNNGWHDTAEAYFASNSIIDTDGDGVPDYLDLDSDNDSVFDVDEAGLIYGDGDINGDGVGDGDDADKDGILDVFDNLIGFGNSGRSLPINTFGSGNPDYMKTISRIPGVYDISQTLYAYLDASPVDGIIDGNSDADKDGIIDSFDTKTNSYGSPRDLNRKLLIEFDGRNDYGQSTAVLGGLSNATLMAWIDLDNAFSSEGVIIGQDKFHLKIAASKKLEAVINSTTVTFNTTLNTKQWYHVAAVYGGGFIRLYLNGLLVQSQVMSGNISADSSLFTIAKNPSSNTKYFKGKIDEIRVFNIALNDDQLQKIVYQEIKNNNGQIRGEIIPKDIPSLPFSNVLRYYRMDVFKDDVIDDLTTPEIDLVGAKIYNVKKIAEQQAPMPFITNLSGNFSNAVASLSNDIRGLDIKDYDWSIVNVKHNITETANQTDLGMIVDTGVVISMNNDTKIQNSWYLKLDGKIDLVNKSQLIQSTLSDLDPTSNGILEKDQQGQTNKHNYNYWTSPVGAINSITNNNPFTVANIMKDATNPDAIQNIQWTSSVNGAATSPITLSSYWIYKFQNLSNNYSNWAWIGQNGTINPGQGFTLKGSGKVAPIQNYTFIGKPNNGTINVPMAANNMNLCGNPFASAIDADKFIDDNISCTTGTLFFWEHYNTNNSHITVQYQGGYGTYTKVGGTPPVAPSGVSGLGSSSKSPKRFIPVGQGFFVMGSNTGGTITFNNSQRLFIKEDNSNSYNLFRAAQNNLTNNDNEFNNSEDNFESMPFKKIRLGFNSADNYHRQILLGFMDEYASEGIDNGYDGVSIENLTNDLYFKNGSVNLNIQGEGFFNPNKVYPLEVKNAVEGLVTFMIDDIENFDENQDFFIHDNTNNSYHSIKYQSFQTYLPIGICEKRFSLRFTNGNSLSNNTNELGNEVSIIHSQSDNNITILNNQIDTTVNSVILVNLLGQKITSWQIENPNQTTINIPVKNITPGVYIIKVKTNKRDYSKKIAVKTVGTEKNK